MQQLLLDLPQSSLMDVDRPVYICMPFIYYVERGHIRAASYIFSTLCFLSWPDNSLFKYFMIFTRLYGSFYARVSRQVCYFLISVLWWCQLKSAKWIWITSFVIKIYNWILVIVQFFCYLVHMVLKTYWRVLHVDRKEWV